MASLARRAGSCLISSLLLTAAAAAKSPPAADLVVTQARVYTADAGRSMAEAIAVRDGKIVFVGSSNAAKAFIGPHTTVKPLAGRLVLPGLFDSHIHPGALSISTSATSRVKPKTLER